VVNVQPLADGDPRRVGDYDVTGRLGEGGQGVVYLGRGHAGPVAIKVLHAQLIEDEQARARFVREVEVTKRVARFCTAQVLSAGLAGGRPYIVSEYVPGPSLHRQLRDEGPRRGSALDRLAINTATALAAIHGAGVVHRDFKPGNVLMGPDGPVVIDFGISRALDASGTMTSAVSQVVGTPAFMAPEQLADGVIGPPTDMFAWAVTMVYAATGVPAFGHRSIPQVINRILHEEPDLGALEHHLRPIVAACLSKDPASRPAARDLMDALMSHNVPPAAGTPGGAAAGAAGAVGAVGAVGAMGALGAVAAGGRTGDPSPAAYGSEASGSAASGSEANGSAASGSAASGTGGYGTESGPGANQAAANGAEGNATGGNATEGAGTATSAAEPYPAAGAGSGGRERWATGEHGATTHPATAPWHDASADPSRLSEASTAHLNAPGASPQVTGAPSPATGAPPAGTAALPPGAGAAAYSPAGASATRIGSPDHGTMRLPSAGTAPPSSGAAGGIGSPGARDDFGHIPDHPERRKGRTLLIAGAATAVGIALIAGIGALVSSNDPGSGQQAAAPPTPAKRLRHPGRHRTPPPTHTPTRQAAAAATKSVKKNPHTPQGLCGAGYRVVDAHPVGEARVYLLYNSHAGTNCVVTLVARSRGKMFLNASLAVKGGSHQSRSTTSPFYAGPVRLPAKGKCVVWGGAARTVKWMSGWSHCGK
jgi:predicted Ser/Thr protein kinase